MKHRAEGPPLRNKRSHFTASVRPHLPSATTTKWMEPTSWLLGTLQLLFQCCVASRQSMPLERLHPWHLRWRWLRRIETLSSLFHKGQLRCVGMINSDESAASSYEYAFHLEVSSLLTRVLCAINLITQKRVRTPSLTCIHGTGHSESESWDIQGWTQNVVSLVKNVRTFGLKLPSWLSINIVEDKTTYYQNLF